jgi:hypothetical protein
MIALLTLVYTALVVVLFKLKLLKPRPFPIAWVVLAGISFAIPVDEVNRVVPELVAHGKVAGQQWVTQAEGVAPLRHDQRRAAHEGVVESVA